MPQRTSRHFHPSRRTALGLALAALAITGSQGAYAQDAANFPNKPIKIVSPHGPGGLGDTFARYIGQQLSAAVGQPVIVENRPGASQTIAAESVAKSAPDGYTLLIATQSAMVFNPVLRKKLPYDPLNDFTPITMLFDTPTYLVVNKDVPVKTVAELIKLAKASPGKLTYASLGPGSSHHLLSEMFKKQAGVDILHIPYKSSAGASTDLIAGQVNMMFEGGASSLPHVKAGKLTALASSGEKRTEIMPDLPTVSETLPGFAANVWFGLSGPAGMPDAIADKLNREVVKILKEKATHDKFVDLGVELLPTTRKEMAERIAKEIPHYRTVAQDAGIQPE
ncbi:Tripartite tricarboxylate transporter family receptor [Pigmentiphaga humi]|uniref:Tripartite tricarboxylate transporter family receptor n=1 Tax=Pigmentiphaga humi TaxID=2478468 RepID=A0A3P4B294_9BURK|nr:tripartite tricarboxylate transporter substrate binding protein [Pigmentiphaga humi]VCU69758.1 Tripartite tricarboxylate transporter family receptor [Pigmentiphaga humi]